jgi:hypothetical protein
MTNFKSNFPITFIWGHDSNGKEAHFFIIAPEYKLDLIASKHQFSAHEYGNVIASGFGFLPNDSTLEKLKSEFGYNFAIPSELA